MMYIDTKPNEITKTKTGEPLGQDVLLKVLSKLELSSFEGSLAEYSEHIEIIDENVNTIRRFDSLMNYRNESGRKDKVKCFNEKEVNDILTKTNNGEFLKIEQKNAIFFFRKLSTNTWTFVNVLIGEL